MKAVFFDTETTGLVQNRSIPLSKQPEIVEFYACSVDLKKGKVIREINFLFKPERPMGDEVMRIHGITNAMVEGEGPFRSKAGIIKSFLEKEAPVVIAHNIKFDVDMVDLEFLRLDKKVKWPQRICTVEQTQHIKGFRLNLSNLHEYLFGEKFVGAHRAKVDVQALVRCGIEMHKLGLL